MKKPADLLFLLLIFLSLRLSGQESTPAFPLLSIGDTLNKGADTLWLTQRIPMKEVEMFKFNHNLPALAGRTAGAYYTPGSGGFCDGSLSLRGFDPSQVLTTLNGIPESAPDEGNISWYTLAGLEDFTREVRVERGITGSHYLSLPGGHTEITTVTGEEFRELFAGASYSSLSGYKGLIRYLSGPRKKGFAFAGGLSLNRGHTYIEASEINAYCFYGALTKKFNNRHQLNAFVWVIPQEHWQNYYHPLTDSTYLEFGSDLNPGWGYLNGVPKTVTKNRSTRGVAQLQYTFSISERHQFIIQANFDYLNNSNTIPCDNIYGFPGLFTDDLHLDFNSIYSINQLHYGTYSFPSGDTVTGSFAWIYLLNEKQKVAQTGLTATWIFKPGNGIQLRAGGFANYHRKESYNEVADLLGGDFTVSIWEYPIWEGDIISGHTLVHKEWGGLYAEVGYNKKGFHVIGSGCVHMVFLQGNDYSYYSLNQEIPITQDPRWGMNIKLKATYDLPYSFSIFLQGGYLLRQPAPFRFSNEAVGDLPNENHGTGELGLRFKNKKYFITLSGYYTRWLNQDLQRYCYDPSTRTFGIVGIRGTHSTRAGIELESELLVHPRVKISLNGYYGWWKYDQDVHSTVTSVSGNSLYILDLYLDGLYIGGQPQSAAMLSVWYSPYKRTAVALEFNVFDRMYSEFNIETRTEETDREQAYKVPTWCTLDLTVSHRFIFKKTFGMQLSGSMTNILNTPYFTTAIDGWMGHHERSSSLFYRGPGRGFVIGLGFFL